MSARKAEAESQAWPVKSPVQGGMVSLTFDDGLDVHLDHAAPTLSAYNLRGTFYVPVAGSSLTMRHRQWRHLAEAGHELGNHTIFHPAVSTKSWVSEGIALENYTWDRMRQELIVASQVLSMLDGEVERTFAFPCSNPTLGRAGVLRRLIRRSGLEYTRVAGWVDRWRGDLADRRRDYRPLAAELFLAARGGGLTREMTVPAVRHFDRFNLPSPAVDNWTLRQLCEYTQHGLESSTWVILQFHGVGGGHALDCDLSVFRQFVEWLADNHASNVLTVRDGAKRVWGSQGDTPG